jgi:hypothetical protein
MRNRLIAFAVLCLATIAAAGAYVVRGGADTDRTPPRAALAQASLKSPPGAGSIVFRSLERADPSRYGFAALASRTHLNRRQIVPLPCGRIYFAAGRGLCLEPAGAVTKQKVSILDRRLRRVGDVTLQGVPSRARVSPDGRFGTVTFFVFGHSYATPGAFSTQTTIVDLAKRKAIANIESFDVTRDGKRFDSPDFNFWGVTFAADSDRFYATLASRGKTYLVQGSVAKRSARVLRENVECPSLSPDGKRIAFKKRVKGLTGWRLHVLDLATLRDRPLAEARSVDDQAEWLDADHVLYALKDSVWLVPADGSGSPKRLLRGADSPAVVRAA